MKYQIHDEPEEIFDTIEEALEYLYNETYHDEDWDEFSDWLNNEYEGTTIYGTYYSPYEIVNAMDEDRLYTIFDHYKEICDEDDRTEAIEDAENAGVGDHIWYQNNQIDVVDDDVAVKDEEDEEEYTIDELREKLDKTNKEKECQILSEKEEDDTLLKMLQVIGG